jgi:hypothetical protein
MGPHITGARYFEAYQQAVQRYLGKMTPILDWLGKTTA